MRSRARPNHVRPLHNPLPTISSSSSSSSSYSSSSYSITDVTLPFAGGADKDTALDSGNHSFRHFCPQCGAPVQTVSPSRESLAIIKMGLFAKSPAWGKQIEAPQAQIFTRNKKSWEPTVEGAAVVEAGPN